MITASNIYIQYGERVLLDNITFVIGDRDKIGLVGRNGAGKSTLIKILAGYLSSEKGTIDMPSGSTLGFLHQEIEIKTGKTVIEETLTAFEDALKLEARIEAINQEIAERDDYESESYTQLLNELTEANFRFNILGGYAMESEAEKVLKGLGFQQSDFTRKTEEFSGGWKMRIELAKILLRKPNYLLLDEPNNHLDIEAIIWLEQFLRDYEGAVVIISHDKMFLDNITNRTVEIEFGNLYDYKAPYSKFVELRALRREKLEAEFKNQQAKIAQTEKLIDKFRAKASKAKFAQSLIKQLDRMDKVAIDPEDSRTMRIRFMPAPRTGDVVVEGKNIVKNYGRIEVLKGVDFKLDRGERVAFVGQNGQGKTTLSRILIEDLKLTSGTVKLGHNVKIGYYAQNQAETLPSELTLLEAMEEAAPAEMINQARGILGAFLFSGEDVDKKVSVLSGGERARLALACLLLKPLNLLVLDEPTNHLDIISKDILKQAIQKYDGALIVVSHDRDFLQELTSRTVEFKNHQLFEHLGDVTTFLAKKNLDSMRELGIKNKEPDTKTTDAPQNQAKTYEEQKDWDRAKRKLEKKVLTSERRIEKLEKLIAEYELKMADPKFYNRDDYPAVIKEYQEAKREVNDAMLHWEEAHQSLEDFLADS